MDALAAGFATGLTTVGLTVLLYWSFAYPLPEQRKKKWRQCPACKRWQEVK
jgi:hypothetical protein